MSLEGRWEQLFKEQVGDSSAWLEVVQENSLFPPDIDPDTYDYTPARGNVFKAFAMLEPNKVKYLVIGQDPYPDESLATGVAFLVPRGRQSTSLKKLKGKLFPDDEGADLEKWASDAGVLLINAALTTPKGEKAAGGHLNDWKEFTMAVIRCARRYSPNAEIIALGVPAGEVAKQAVISCCNHPAYVPKNQAEKAKFDSFWETHGPLRAK